MIKRKSLIFGIIFIVAFFVWTLLVRFVDVQQIGPNGSSVGFATLNGAFRDFIGVNMSLYVITDWLSLVPLLIAFGFAVLGLKQLIKEKKLTRVDFSILALGGFYVVVISIYILFEMIDINYRPVLINGYLERSYPSSTTVLVMCIMLTSIMQLKNRIKNKVARWSIIGVMIAFAFFMVIGRVLSGVHWITDIVGGAQVSAGLALIYHSLSAIERKKSL